jgi:hypothetical protein
VTEAGAGLTADATAKLRIKERSVVIGAVYGRVTLHAVKLLANTIVSYPVPRRRGMTLQAQAIIRLSQEAVVVAAMRVVTGNTAGALGAE